MVLLIQTQFDSLCNQLPGAIGHVVVVLTHLASENLAIEHHIEVHLAELLDSLNNLGSPADGQRSQSIPLVQVGVHVLLHGFTGHLVKSTLLVILLLGHVHVLDQVHQLSQRKLLLVFRTERHLGDTVGGTAGIGYQSLVGLGDMGSSGH
jgi:hypothetical protein